MKTSTWNRVRVLFGCSLNTEIVSSDSATLLKEFFGWPPAITTLHEGYVYYTIPSTCVVNPKPNTVYRILSDFEATTPSCSAVTVKDSNVYDLRKINSNPFYFSRYTIQRETVDDTPLRIKTYASPIDIGICLSRNEYKYSALNTEVKINLDSIYVDPYEASKRDALYFRESFSSIELIMDENLTDEEVHSIVKMLIPNVFHK